MIVLKILAAPVMVALSLLAAMVTFLFCVASAVCELGCIVLTLLSRMLSIALKMPSTVFIVTGIFPLVPGAGIYHTAYALVSRNMEAFTLRGMQTLALAGAIALGILIGMGFPKLLVETKGPKAETTAADFSRSLDYIVFILAKWKLLDY